jgi:hypothetical protein
MIEVHLSGMKARNGTGIFVCSTCKVVVERWPKEWSRKF